METPPKYASVDATIIKSLWQQYQYMQQSTMTWEQFLQANLGF